MRGAVVWAAVVVGSAGVSADVAGQSAATGRRPSPAAFLLPPVAASSDLPPARADAGRDRPPPPTRFEPVAYSDADRRPPADLPVIEPSRRSRPQYDRPAPDPDAFDDADRRPPRPRFAGTPRPARDDRPEFEDRPVRDDRTPIRPVRDEPVRDDLVGDDPVRDDRAPADDEPRVDAKTKPAVYEPPVPAARLARPSDIRPVSAEVVADARSMAQADRPPPGDLIEYLHERPLVNAPDLSREVGKFGDKLFGRDNGMDVLGVDGGRDWFCSDKAFPTFVSPVTNPFQFEDPRSTTEIRPIVVYQKVPKDQTIFNGGSLYFVGTQARIAFTPRVSLVINKLGGLGINPDSNINPFVGGDEFGFAELWLGPKFTLIRDTEFGTLLAAGATFQIPVGSADVFQNTGDLSITPYLTYGQNFLQTRFGSFNGLVGTGYAFSVNDKRSDYYFLSGHVDFDVGNYHRFYPLVEMNWHLQTTDGSSSPLPFEGRDLINFGSQAQGANLLTGAVGARVKVFAASEIGAAFEFPLIGNDNLFDYRVTVDFIWRY